VTVLPVLHVLLVEDDDDTREVLRFILESDGIAVTQAQDGLDAFARILELREHDPTSPSAIILDYMMPRCSGAQFRERQLASPGIADVPVVLVSAVSDLPQRAAVLHPFAVLQKPVDPEDLTAVVRRACETYLNARGRGGAVG